jgi:hypothetical protein
MLISNGRESEFEALSLTAIAVEVGIE